jgi:hypothetical protein
MRTGGVSSGTSGDAAPGVAIACEGEAGWDASAGGGSGEAGADILRARYEAALNANTSAPKAAFHASARSDMHGVWCVRRVLSVGVASAAL